MPAPRLKHIYILCYYAGNQFPCDLSRNSFNLLVSLLHGYQEAHIPEKHCPCTDRESFRSVSEVLLQVTAGKQRPHTNIYRDLINQPCSVLLIIDVHRIPFFSLGLFKPQEDHILFGNPKIYILWPPERSNPLNCYYLNDICLKIAVTVTPR